MVDIDIDTKNESPRKEKKMFIGVVWNCAAELKLLLTALLFLTSLLTIFQFLPSQLSFSSFCILPEKVGPTNPLITTTSLAGIIPPDNGKSDGNPLNLTKNPLNITGILTDPSPPENQDEKLPTGVMKRRFNTYGAVAYNFILMSAYRGGLNTFAINGLSSKHCWKRSFIVVVQYMETTHGAQ